MRIIKKYNNRRLYDTKCSQYITLNDIKQLVLDKVDFKVIDKQTEKELPIFVNESELKEFTSALSFGIELTETSKWTPEENRLPPIE